MDSAEPIVSQKHNPSPYELPRHALSNAADVRVVCEGGDVSESNYPATFEEQFDEDDVGPVNGYGYEYRYGDKRIRGRPRGSKNRSGHRAGRPRKDGEEHMYAAKRARTGSPAQDGGHQGLAFQSHSGSVYIEPRSSILLGDIPVDPSIMGSISSAAQDTLDPPFLHSSHAIDHAAAGSYYHASSSSAFPGASDIRYSSFPSLSNEGAHLHAYDQQSNIDVYDNTIALSHPQLLPATNANLARPNSNDFKGKGKARPFSSPLNQVTTIIRDLLPKDYVGAAPRISGPFRLRADADGRQMLEGPIETGAFEGEAGPTYVYIANYRPGPALSSDPPVNGARGGLPTGPLPLATWKVSHPLTSEGKDRVRGPRRCGYCGRLECRGRGGRTWCPDYKPDKLGLLPRTKAASPDVANRLSKQDPPGPVMGDYHSASGSIPTPGGGVGVSPFDSYHMGQHSLLGEGELNNSLISSMIRHLLPADDEDGLIDDDQERMLYQGTSGGSGNIGSLAFGDLYSAEGIARQVNSDMKLEVESAAATVMLLTTPETVSLVQATTPDTLETDGHARGQGSKTKMKLLPKPKKIPKPKLPPKPKRAKKPPLSPSISARGPSLRRVNAGSCARCGHTECAGVMDSSMCESVDEVERMESLQERMELSTEVDGLHGRLRLEEEAFNAVL